MKTSLKQILKEKNITYKKDDFNFKSQNEEINFLKKLESIQKNNIDLNYLNDELINVILKIDLNEENLQRIKKINWHDFQSFFTSSAV